MAIGITCGNTLFYTNLREPLLYFQPTVGKKESSFAELSKGRCLQELFPIN